MKHLIIALSLALVASIPLAQAAGEPPAAGKGATVKRIQADLNLTDEQIKKMRQIRDEGGTRAEMQAVLTPEQRAKSAALRNKHKSEGGDRKARMQEQLGLSDAQANQMAQIRQRGGSQEEMRAVLTPEQQAKFDTLRSQHPRAKPAQTPAAKPAAAPAANPAPAPAANPATSPAPSAAAPSTK